MKHLRVIIRTLIEKILRWFGLTVLRSDRLANLHAVLSQIHGERDAALGERDAALTRVTELSRLTIQKVHGHRMYGAPDDAGFNIAAMASMEPDMGIHFIRRTVKPGQIVVDLGANVGLYTLALAECVGAMGRVFAFEPGPLSYGLLQANVALNAYRNVVVENAAVVSKSGTVDLFLCRSGESDNRVGGTLSDPEERDRVTARGISLDDYFPSGTNVDFIKVDVQGSEPMAFEGMRRVLADSPTVQIMMEYAPGGLEVAACRPRDFLAMLIDLGFDLAELTAAGPIPRSSEWFFTNIGKNNPRQQAEMVLRRRANRAELSAS